MKKSVIAAAVLSFSVMTTAYASEFITAPIENDYKLKLEGSDDGARVGLVIKNSEMNWEDIQDDSIKDNSIVFLGEYLTDDGNYAIEQPLKEKSGLYSVVLGSESGARLEDILLMYTNPNENKNAMKALIDAAKVSEEEMIKTAKENRYSLQFYLPLSSTVSESDAFKALYEYAVSDSASSTDGKTAADIYRGELIVTALNEKKLTQLYDYFSYMNIEDERIDKWYVSASDDFKKKVNERLSGINIKGAKDFETKLIEAIILQKVQTPDGYVNIVSILKDFAAETGFEQGIITTNNCSVVAGKNYTSYNALKNALSEANKNKPSSGGGGGGTSSPASGSHKGSVSSIESNTSGTQIIKPLDVSYFTDLDNYGWAKEAVKNLFEKGIVSGRGNGIFAPQDAVTREEIVKMLVLAMDLADDSPCESFGDVDSEAWYAPYITSAVNKGVVNGIDGGLFGIGQSVTRQDMAVMLYRIIGNKYNAEANTEFSDINDVADYAVEAVKYMSETGIFDGYEDGTFRPLQPVTRAEAAAVIFRILDK